MSENQRNIEALLSEHRVFEPPPGFVERAIVADASVYEQAGADHEAFWAEQAERLTWFKRWDRVMEWTPPWVRWFDGGRSTPPTTASTATSRPAGATRSRSTGRASRATRARSRTRSCWTRSVASRTRCDRSGSARETG